MTNIRIAAKAIGASAAAAAAAAFAIAAPGFAHPHDGEKKIEKVILVTGKDGATPGEHRSIRIDGSEVRCEGDRTTTIDEGPDSKARTKIVLCGAGTELSADEQAKKLEGVLARIRSDEHFSAEHKARVEASLQEAIAKLRAGN